MPETSKSNQRSASASQSLWGTANIPGDKSISHRALILGSLAIGETKVADLLESSDVMNTAQAMRAFGSIVKKNKDKTWSIFGVGVGGYCEPDKVIDCGNSGTAIRLIMGAMSTSPITATFTGDHSLIKRPMGRVLEPLKLFGTKSLSRENGLLPLTISGSRMPIGVKYFSQISSAQVKSAILLGALNSIGDTTYQEPELSRDHTEKMLSAFGADISIENNEMGSSVVLRGPSELVAQNIFVPGDPSSAAFPICAALMVPKSKITIPNVCQNPTRNGLIVTLKEMGANIEIANLRNINGELVGDLSVSSSNLKGVEVPPERVVSMIDEYPILAAVASVAEGTTVMKGLKELRVKESDRLSAMAQGLTANGIKVSEGEDSLSVIGRGLEEVPGGAKVRTFFDHRIAMSFLCLGLASKNPITIDDSRSIDTSFPTFFKVMSGLGAEIR
tara:strand:+ start:163 stop:1500 length:1338 start_codon:yes stop_codon:yes gene_type:complete